jgi:hypothetical protein
MNLEFYTLLEILKLPLMEYYFWLSYKLVDCSTSTKQLVFPRNAAWMGTIPMPNGHGGVDATTDSLEW